ncbi:MAG: ATP-binding protein [Kiritimatiellae bacterium]|nr:ATP-binding protein [Kiritimatiellia bacterium]
MIGRKKELAVLADCIAADRSRLVVVYGRRRVGKTFLVREAFDYHFTFTHTGLENGSLREQLSAFWSSLRRQCHVDSPVPRNWMEAFESLKDAIEVSGDARKTIFLDELPWMDTRNSGFVKAIEAFWNGWASARKDVMMVVCGSAAAWMSKKILHNRGGLFNRANRTIRLEPFTLAECEAFALAEGLVMDRKDLVAAYMVFGGAPYYWSLLDRGESLSQNIDRLFFSEGAELADEFGRLYKSVFASPEPYIAAVSALGRKKAGMTREELAAAIPGAANDGTLTETLRNLETSGFVRRYVETGNSRKGSVFQLIDNYTLFFFQFVQGRSGRDSAFWSHMLHDSRRTAWEGLAFERVCLRHSAQIKAALGISGIETKESAWRCSSRDPDVKGAQIDLVIERADRVVNLCEMKFCSEQFSIDAGYAASLREKVGAFKRETGTRANCHLTFVTTYGLRRNKYSSIAQSEVTLDDLFRP